MPKISHDNKNRANPYTNTFSIDISYPNKFICIPKTEIQKLINDFIIVMAYLPTILRIIQINIAAHIAPITQAGKNPIV